MILKIENICKKFKDVDVLKDVNMELTGGKIYGFIGRNGSGKSVLLKIICGFYYPSSGIILLDNYNYIKKNEFPKSTRALIEKPSFIPDLTGYENLLLLASIQNKITKDDIEKALDDVNLISEKNKKYSKYSLGMKQKLGIAQVLMENPNIMIFDEPLNGIESETADKIRRILIQKKKEGKIIIVASHIKEDIDNLADVIYKFDNNTVVEIKDKK
jgi:ABC-2 type transport system ATP-binding protein